MILKKKKTEHVTPLLLQLHWLPVRARIAYKVAVLCHKCLHGRAPSYLVSLIDRYVPSRTLRSKDKHLLRVPKKGKKRFADRSFQHFGPAIWNSLPGHLRDTKSEITFKSGLKTHLMRLHLCN